MEFLIELVLSCFVEGAEELAISKRVPKWVSYTFGILLFMFYAAIFLLLFLVSFMIMKSNMLFGTFLFVIFIILFAFFIKKVKEIYTKIKR